MEATFQFDDPINDAAPWHIWVVGLMTLMWNGYCVSRFLMVQAGFVEAAALRVSEMAVFADMPTWATAFWAMWVIGSVTGSALALLRSQGAVTALLVAAVGMVGTSIYLAVLHANPANIYAMPITLSTVIITIASLLYVRRAALMNVLR